MLAVPSTILSLFWLAVGIFLILWIFNMVMANVPFYQTHFVSRGPVVNYGGLIVLGIILIYVLHIYVR